MKQYSIRRYVGLLTLVPMIVIAACLEFFFLNSYFNELDRHVVERAKLIASQLGSSSESVSYTHLTLPTIYSV